MAQHKKRAGAALTATGSTAIRSAELQIVHNRKPILDASAFARAWVARRYRVRSRWAGVIAEAAGLGGRA